jgi:hypothetical protein
MNIAQLILSAILAIFPYMSGNNRACIVQRQERIVQHATEGRTNHNVPELVMMAVGFSETHLGCDINEGGNWGAPISRHRRHTAGTPGQAAAVLRRSYEVCGNWSGAISRFRCGLCSCRGSTASYTPRVIGLMRTISTRSGVPMPDNMGNPNRLTARR